MNKDNRLLAEAYKKVVKSKKLGDITSFEGLPDNIPYGFCVYSDGSVDVVVGVIKGGKDHETVFREKGIEDYEEYYSEGCARVAYSHYDDIVMIQADTLITSSGRAIKTAKDIAKWYQKDYKFEELEDLEAFA